MASILKSKNKKNSPAFESIYIYVLMIFVGYVFADLAILNIRQNTIPTKAAPAKARKLPPPQLKSASEYQSIISRNIFNSDGLIPDPLQSKEKDGGGENAEPVLSQLPLELVGTLVHVNPIKSLATINLKGKSQIKSFVAGDEIENMAKLVRVERLKAIFRNLNNGRMEFISIDTGEKVNFGVKYTPQGETGEIARAGNNFVLKRETLDKYLANFDEVITQARAVPHTPPGSGGRIEGFRILSIVPGSIYTTLGLERMDIIKKVNGDLVNSPAKAMELYNALKGSSDLVLEIERNGRVENFNYKIE